MGAQPTWPLWAQAKRARLLLAHAWTGLAAGRPWPPAWRPVGLGRRQSSPELLRLQKVLLYPRPPSAGPLGELLGACTCPAVHPHALALKL